MVAVSTNPKKAFGTKKPGVHFIPPVAILEEAVVMALGAAKYGAFNWVKDPVDATTYIDAIDRHLKQWQTGEDADAESGASHLAHIRACCAILLDAQAIGNLIDDRSKGTASATAAIDRLKKQKVEDGVVKVGDHLRDTHPRGTCCRVMAVKGNKFQVAWDSGSIPYDSQYSLWWTWADGWEHL